MKKKELKKLIKAVKVQEPKAIMAELMGNKKVSHKDIPAINKIMETAGILVNEFKVMTAVRKLLTNRVLKGITTWGDVTTLVDQLEDKHDLPSDKLVSTIRNAMKRIKLTMPRKPSLGATKQAIVDYVTGNENPSSAGLKKHLLVNVKFDEDKVKNEEKAQHAVSMNFSFAMSIVTALKQEATDDANAVEDETKS